MNPLDFTRRHFLQSGVLAAAAALGADVPHFAPKARRVIYLFMSGGPSQMDLFDHKPELKRMHGQEIPPSVRGNQRLTSMSGTQSQLPLAGSPFVFKQHGRSGAWMSEVLPRTAKVADDLCILPAVHTEAINHDPAITFFCTGSQIAGRPSMGAWLGYGLGSLNRNLPAFVVLVTKKGFDQPIYARLWGSGFLPSEHQGVQFRAGKDPVLFLANPEGVSPHQRRALLDGLARLDAIQLEREMDPSVRARMAAAEMAFRMQTSVPEVMDLSGEPDEVYTLYGPDSRKPGTFAANCLLARRLAERGVRFIQLFHPGWDAHFGCRGNVAGNAAQVDQGQAALITDLKRRGMLEETLVLWGGEFGRTAYSQGRLTPDNFGRDHHPRCFTMWMAGGGIKGGLTWGRTDDFSYNVAEGGIHVHDLHATMLHCLGIDHEKLIYRYQGRDFRLTDVHGIVQKQLLA